MSPSSTNQTERPQPLPQTGEMPVRTKEGRIPRRHPERRNSTNGPDKSEGNCRLATPQKCQRCLRVPRIHRVLLILCTQLLQNRMSPHRTHKEDNPISLEGSTN
jgi:hypothetical protein